MVRKTNNSMAVALDISAFAAPKQNESDHVGSLLTPTSTPDQSPVKKTAAKNTSSKSAPINKTSVKKPTSKSAPVNKTTVNKGATNKTLAKATPAKAAAMKTPIKRAATKMTPVKNVSKATGRVAASWTATKIPKKACKSDHTDLNNWLAAQQKSDDDGTAAAAKEPQAVETKTPTKRGIAPSKTLPTPPITPENTPGKKTQAKKAPTNKTSPLRPIPRVTKPKATKKAAPVTKTTVAEETTTAAIKADNAIPDPDTALPSIEAEAEATMSDSEAMDFSFTLEATPTPAPTEVPTTPVKETPASAAPKQTPAKAGRKAPKPKAPKAAKQPKAAKEPTAAATTPASTPEPKPAPVPTADMRYETTATVPVTVSEQVFTLHNTAGSSYLVQDLAAPQPGDEYELVCLQDVSDVDGGMAGLTWLTVPPEGVEAAVAHREAVGSRKRKVEEEEEEKERGKEIVRAVKRAKMVFCRPGVDSDVEVVQYQVERGWEERWCFPDSDDETEDEY